MKIFYIILAILGIVLPYWAMFSSILIDQYTVRQFFSAWFENNAVRMIAADLGVAGTTFSVYIIYSFKQGNGPPIEVLYYDVWRGFVIGHANVFLKKEMEK